MTTTHQATDESLPSGTITFFFTDVEGSTRMVQALGDAWVGVLERHDAILAEAVENNGGFPIKTEGDSLFAVFSNAPSAVNAAAEAQRRLAAETWPEGQPVRVRMGVHTGQAALVGSDYVGLEVHRAARISDAAHGGQIVVSDSTAVLVQRELRDGLSITDLGKHRLKDLSEPEALFQVTVAGLQKEFPELRTLDAIPNNLPAQVTSFVGREEELATAIDLLDRTRVLTLTGPGGTGKTRLSLQLAADVGHQFDDGVFFVGLSPVTKAEVVPSAILNSLGLSASSGDESPEERLLDQVRSKSVLLVLDNFEQLLDAAPLVASLVRASPRSKFVVTSRAPLRISGEQELPVPPLATADTSSLEDALEMESVQLLIDRAMAIRPDFAVTKDNLSAVLDLVRRLDGLPLAIELVVPRLRLAPIETIVERLDARMLSSGSVDLPERQQTISNAIEWGYDLLSPDVQTLFCRLGVFSGGARLDEIETLCARWDLGSDLFDGLETLVDQSLIGSLAFDGMPRFRMLHVIREFALDRLEATTEAAETHRAHLEVFLDLTERTAPEFLKKDRNLWLDVLETEHDNIRTAIQWGLTNGEVDLVLRLVAAAWRFWQARGHLHEAQRLLEEVLALSGGEDRYRAKAIEALGGINWWRGQMDQAFARYEEALEMQRHLDDERELANAIYNFGLVFGFHLKDQPRALELLGEAREIYVRLDDADGLGDIAWGMGNVFIGGGDYEQALPLFTEATKHYRVAGNEFGLGWSAFETGALMSRTGKPDDAWPYLSDALSLFASHHDVSGVVLTGSELAGVALHMGDSARAYRLAGMVGALRAKSGTDLVEIAFNIIEGLEPATLQALKGEDLAAYTSGMEADFEDIVDYALAGPIDG